jgi:hypothetical protein
MEVDLNNDGDGMTNIEIMKKAKKLNLPNFKYRMRDELKKDSPLKIEFGVLNLDKSDGAGTHHCAWYKNNNKKIYFDSYGIVPPIELVKYLKSPILYNTYQIQQFNDTNCSEWALYVLDKLNKGNEFVDIILEIVNNNKLY